MSRRVNTKRNVNGILLVDKPLKMSSNGALQEVKKLFNARKAGHTGSLDPLATGMLPLCFGEATKFCQFLLDADKCYHVIGKLGEKTTTSDSEGEVIQRVEDFSINEPQLQQVLNQFRGEIEQVPSMFSALKHNGMPLYKLARQGIEVERKPRKVIIRSMELMSFDGVHFELTVVCSKGTYIRNLVEDIGDVLKLGAHVTQLRRLYSCPYETAKMWTLDQLIEIANNEPQNLDELLLAVDTAVAGWPQVSLDSSLVFYVQNGQSVDIPGLPNEGWVRLCDSKNHFIGMGQIQENGQLAPKRLLKKISA